MSDTAPADAPAVGTIPFSIASRPQRRFSAVQTVSNLAGPTSFQPIPLTATGYVRKVALYFQVNGTCGSAGAVVAGDGPWNLISGISLSDATGQPVFQPVSGYNLYLINKFIPNGIFNDPNVLRSYANPHQGPEFAYSATATTFTATFRLDLDFEQDSRTGYGSIPNLDANAALQLKIDVAPITAAFSGTGITVANVSVTVDQWYWAVIGATVGGAPVQTTPPGYGDYSETRYETNAVNAGSENLVALNAKGGYVRSVLCISRAAGVRTAYQPNTNVGVVYDNVPIDEGIRLEAIKDSLRRAYGYMGADIGTSYAPLGAGTSAGIDNGVMVFNFGAMSGNRDSWLPTRIGSLVQLKLTPGAGATTLEVVTQLMQTKSPAAFFDTGR